MNGFKIASRFITRNVIGCLIAIGLGMKIDSMFHTTPWVMVVLIMYVIIGSLFLLTKEISNGK